MSMFTQKMRMLTAVVMDNDREKVVKALLEKGVMEFVHIGTLPADKMQKLSAHASTIPRAALTDMRVRKGFIYILLTAAAISLSPCHAAQAAEPDREELNLMQAANEMRGAPRP